MNPFTQKSRSRFKRSTRGQALVLFALTILFVTLMVVITVQIALRAHDTVEAQMTADAAAYSNAVATARTYNMFAIIGRARLAHMVALLSTQSLISWTGQQRMGTLKSIQVVAACDPAVGQRLMADFNTDLTQWNQLDEAAADLARQHQSVFIRLKTQVANPLFDSHLETGSPVHGQRIARALAALADPGGGSGGLQAPPLGQQKYIDEAFARTSNLNGSGPALQSTDWDELQGARVATMGTRGWSFVTSRKQDEFILQSAINRRLARIGVTERAYVTSLDTGARGGTGYGVNPGSTDRCATFEEQSMTAQYSSGGGAYGHDHPRSWNVRFGACGARRVDVTGACVKSTAVENYDDLHNYDGDTGTGEDGTLEKNRHTLGNCPLSLPGCPGVFGGYLGYNRARLDDERDDFGQPKNYALIARDYSLRAAGSDSWNPFFRFRFGSSGPGTLFDSGSTEGTFTSNRGASLRRQVALAAGLTYYHRPLLNGRTDAGGYREPPNFYNPFWRATLAPLDGRYLGTGSGYRSDPARYLSTANYTTQADYLEGMYLAGMEGFRCSQAAANCPRR